MRGAAALAIWLAAAPVMAGTGATVQAEFRDPTDRYGHGALGPDHEFATLRVRVSRPRGDGGGIFAGARSTTYMLTLDAALVWEDTAPRVLDLDGDGLPEIVTVQAHKRQGARLVVLRLQDGKPVPGADGPFVGAPNHWLSVIAAGDLDGDGRGEIALIDAPHRIGDLVIYRYEPGASGKPGRLTELGRGILGRGMKITNHRYGEPVAWGGLRDCPGDPEMVVARFDWSGLLGLVMTPEGEVVQRDLGPDAGPAGFAAAMECN